MMNENLSDDLNATINVKGIVSETLKGQTAMAIYGNAGNCGVIRWS